MSWSSSSSSSGTTPRFRPLLAACARGDTAEAETFYNDLFGESDAPPEALTLPLAAASGSVSLLRAILRHRPDSVWAYDRYASRYFIVDYDYSIACDIATDSDDDEEYEDIECDACVPRMRRLTAPTTLDEDAAAGGISVGTARRHRAATCPNKYSFDDAPTLKESIEEVYREDGGESLAALRGTPTALMLAAASTADPLVLQTLLASPGGREAAALRVRTSNALIEAAKGGNVEGVAALIATKCCFCASAAAADPANADATNPSAPAPAPARCPCLAQSCRCLKITTRAPTTGRSVLHAAASSGRADAVKALLEMGAHVNALDAGGKPPLFAALTNPMSPEVLQTLLDNLLCDATIISRHGFSVLDFFFLVIFDAPPNYPQNSRLEFLYDPLAADGGAAGTIACLEALLSHLPSELLNRPTPVVAPSPARHGCRLASLWTDAAEAAEGGASFVSMAVTTTAPAPCQKRRQADRRLAHFRLGRTPLLHAIAVGGALGSSLVKAMLRCPSVKVGPDALAMATAFWAGSGGAHTLVDAEVIEMLRAAVVANGTAAAASAPSPNANTNEDSAAASAAVASPTETEARWLRYAAEKAVVDGNAAALRAHLEKATGLQCVPSRSTAPLPPFLTTLVPCPDGCWGGPSVASAQQQQTLTLQQQRQQAQRGMPLLDALVRRYFSLTPLPCPEVLAVLIAFGASPLWLVRPKTPLLLAAITSTRSLADREGRGAAAGGVGIVEADEEDEDEGQRVAGQKSKRSLIGCHAAHGCQCRSAPFEAYAKDITDTADAASIVLVRAGADVNYPAGFYSLLSSAIARRRYAVAHSLIAAGCDVDAGQGDVLMGLANEAAAARRALLAEQFRRRRAASRVADGVITRNTWFTNADRADDELEIAGGAAAALKRFEAAAERRISAIVNVAAAVFAKSKRWRDIILQSSDVTERLLASGTTVNELEYYEGFTSCGGRPLLFRFLDKPFSSVCPYERRERVRCLRLALDCGMDVDGADDKGRSPMSYALRLRWFAIARLLFLYGAVTTAEEEAAVRSCVEDPLSDYDIAMTL